MHFFFMASYMIIKILMKVGKLENIVFQTSQKKIRLSVVLMSICVIWVHSTNCCYLICLSGKTQGYWEAISIFSIGEEFTVHLLTYSLLFPGKPCSMACLLLDISKQGTLSFNGHLLFWNVFIHQMKSISFRVSSHNFSTFPSMILLLYTTWSSKNLYAFGVMKIAVEINRITKLMNIYILLDLSSCH